MVKSEKELVIIEIVLSIVFLLNIFYKFITNNYLILLLILLTICLIVFLMGYERDKNIDNPTKRKLLLFVGLYSIGFIIFQYGLGFFLNYINSPYRTDLLGIFSNTFLMVLIIISSEYLRYILVKKGEKQKIILVFTFILLVLIDLTLSIKYYNLNYLNELLEYLTLILLPSIFKNYVLTKFAYKYGLRQNILYRLILELYVYVLPFVPDLGMYLQSVLFITFPLILNMIITIEFEKEQKIDYRENKIKRILLPIVIGLFTITLVYLNSNLFRFWIVAVASGSMEPTIEIGDAIIVDKKYNKHLNELKEGDILVFKNDKKIYTHRIVRIKRENNQYSINTKGDRKGQTEDKWIVTNNDVIGVVKAKIKYIGYPTVWLSRMLEGDNE